MNFRERLTPSPVEWVPPERVPGGTDVTGDSLPRCQPEFHKEGKHHPVLCIGGIGVYTRAEDGWWDRIPPHPLSQPGARWFYAGHAYVRPVQRGVALDDGAAFDHLEDLPSGDYDIKVEFIRREPVSE